MSRTYGKGYGINCKAIGNMLENTFGTWEPIGNNRNPTSPPYLQRKKLGPLGSMIPPSLGS